MKKLILKKLLSLTVFGILFSMMVSPVLALSGSELGLDYGTYTGLGTKDLREGVMTIVKYLFGFLGIVAIIGILYGGFIMMTSGGNQEKSAGGQKAVSAGAIGLVIIFVAYAIATFVINQLITATGATY